MGNNDGTYPKTSEPMNPDCLIHVIQINPCNLFIKKAEVDNYLPTSAENVIRVLNNPDMVLFNLFFEG